MANETLGIVSSIIGIVRFRKDKRSADELTAGGITEEPSAEAQAK